jgi:hypothetical protein
MREKANGALDASEATVRLGLNELPDLTELDSMTWATAE